IAAEENARSLEYHFIQKDSELIFDRFFTDKENTKWRNQKISLILKLPVGKKVKLAKSMRRFLYDVDNTTDTYDGDMPGYTWLMTREGLSCMDCENSPLAKHKKKRRKEEEE